MLSEIQRYGFEVALCFDDDEPGRSAVAEVCKIVPSATSITLPCKDANACLVEGYGKAAFKAANFNSAKPKNSTLVWLDQIWDSCKEQAEFGVSWPWDWLTRKTRGIRKKETIYIGGGQKMGKSEFLNALASHLVTEHQWKIMLAKPEENNKKTAKLLAGKVSSTRFHDPEVAFDEEKYNQAGSELLGNKVCMLNLYQHLGWESLKGDIIEGAAQGVDAVFIDPITNLTNGVSSAEANTILQGVAQDLAAMANDLDLAIFIFCHLRNPDSGPSHDRGGRVLTSQFAGSRAMGRSCNYMLGIEGNKDPELPEEERNLRNIVLLDDREYGECGEFGLFWDKKTTQFCEVG
jgi:twinkle protein